MGDKTLLGLLETFKPCAEAKLYNLFAILTMQIFTQGPQQHVARICHHQPNTEDQEVITATINKLLNGQFSV